MTRFPTRSLLACALLLAAAPAFAQSDWTGAYVGGYAGGTINPDTDGDSIRFDTNLDGVYGDTVPSGGFPPDEFDPGFCGGRATGAEIDQGCQGNSGGGDVGLRAGYDWQVGSWVLGVVGEYGENQAREAVSAFSLAGDSYTMSREVGPMWAVRGRVGFVITGSGKAESLVYATAGVAKAPMENRFTTTNTVNAFSTNGETDADGTQWGVGYERMFGEHFAFGIEYIHTSLEDGEARVRAGAGTAAPGDPFIATNPNGTDFRLSDANFELESIRLSATWRF